MLKIILSAVLSSSLLLATGPVLKTGQNRSYDANGYVVTNDSIKDDGYYQAGKVRQYIRSADGVVTDDISGLQWQDNYSDNGGTVPKDDWQGAVEYCSNLALDGGGWRLPTISELKTVDRDSIDKDEIDAIFQNTINYYYWSSTSRAENSNYKWYMHGLVDYGSSTTENYIRCVRRRQLITSDLVRDNARELVTDRVNYLQWQDTSDVNQTKRSWQNAVDYCEHLSLGGYDDWRLPNKNELFSIVDHSRYDPAIYPVFQYVGDRYWSSTVGDSATSYAYYIRFYNGYMNSLSRSQQYLTRCVRGGMLDGLRPPMSINHVYNTVGELHGNLKSNHGAGYDANDSLVTVLLVEDAKHGVVTLDRDKGDFLYEPNNGFTGNDYFTYALVNAAGMGNVAKVSIAVGFADATPPLTVKASVDKKKVTTGEEVHFTASADDGTGQMDSNDYVCTWKFGDGEKVDECDVTKTFDTPGNYRNFVRVITLTGKHAISGNIGVSVTEPKDANLDVVTSMYNVTNIHQYADAFDLYLKAVDKNGVSIEKFCKKYDFKVIDSNNNTIKNKFCIQTRGNSWYRISFKLNDPDPNYVEDAKIKICKKNTNQCMTLKDLNNITVVGTHFRADRDEFRFDNGEWSRIKAFSFSKNADISDPKVKFISEMGKAAKVIASYLSNDDKIDFYESVGYRLNGSKFKNKNIRSHGLCFGMALASAANYNHKDENTYWELNASNFTGKKAAIAFDIDIVKHWNDDTKSINRPYKPFKTHNIFNTFNIYYISRSIDALRKIMYYFVGQPYYFDNSFDKWVGNATATCKYFEDYWYWDLTKPDDINNTISLLKCDQVLPLSFKLENKTRTSGHAVTLVQYINYTTKNSVKHTKWIVYDNNYPYYNWGTFGPYMTFSALHQINSSNIKMYRNFSKKTGLHTAESYSDSKIKDLRVTVTKNSIPADFTTDYNTEDALGIYSDTKTASFTPRSANKRSIERDVVSQSGGVPIDTVTIDNRYMEIIIVGGDVFSVQNSNGDNVSYIEEGEKDGTNVIVSHSGAFTTLYLPVTDTYTVNAGKYAFYPFMEVLQRIPQSDGTVNIVNYDNVELAENDPTEVTFTVGVNNTDKTLHRTTASNPSRDATSLLPAYDGLVEQTFTAPSNFAGLLKGATVKLTWNNSTHPLFDHTVIVRKRGGEPTDIGDGETLYSGTGESVDDNTLDSNTYYYYAAYSVDADGNVSAPSIIKIDTGTWGIEGMVTDAQNGNPVGGASVTLREANATSQDILRTALTDENGHYAFANVAEGNYTLAVSANLYRFDNPEHNISIPEDRDDVDFAGMPVPTVAFISGFESVDANATVKLRWLFRNLDTSETVSVDVDEGNGWQNIAGGVPVTQNVDYTAGSQVYYGAKLRLSLESDTAVNDTFTFNITDTASRFIERFFDEIYKRTPTQTEMTEWLQKLEDNDAAYVARAFYNSPEFGDLNLTDEAYVALLYKTLYGRLPAQSENERWLYDLSNGTSRETMFETLVASDKFQTQPSDTPPAPDCGYVVTPVTLEYDDTAHTGVLTVSSFPEGCTEGSWRSATTADWITLSGDTNGTGPGEWHLHFTIERNDGKNDREGEIEVGKKTVVIDQAAKKVNIMPVIMLLLQ